MRVSLVGIPLVLSAVLWLGCGKSTAVIVSTQPGPVLSPSQTLATNATVRLSPVETACWELDTPQGTYLPTYVPPPYQAEGLAVHVVLRGDTTSVSWCTMIPMVRIDSIGPGWR